MVEVTLAIGSGLTLVAAALYALVGLRFAGRRAARGGHALAFFAAFWLGLAVYGFADGGWTLGLLFGSVPFPVAVLLLHVKVLAATVAFFGLVYYLLYIYTGRPGFLIPLTGAYLALYGVVTYYYAWREPVGQGLRVWGSGIDYARDGGLFGDVVALLLFVPPLLAAGAYALLLRVVREPAKRQRLAAVSVTFLVFFGSTAVGWVQGTWYWWGLVHKLLALAAVGVVAIVTRHDDAPDAAGGADARSGV